MLDRVHIARRFRQSIRIDTDLANITSLDGFVCPQSSADVLRNMVQHIAVTEQGAFTWTGPYGSGKSSLVVALASLLNSNCEIQNYAANVLGNDIATEIWKILPVREHGWHILPVIGHRDHPVNAIGEAMRTTGLVSRRQSGGWTDDYVIKKLTRANTSKSKGYSGVLLIIDEMGKFLEAAVQDSADIYFFQQLAEAASRSNGRLIVVGILHQAFAEYAHQLSREYRDEWTKIQGRFVDLAVNATGDEQIHLISHAIRSDHFPKQPSDTAHSVAKIYHGSRPESTSNLSFTLENCWPLHPLVVCLLGPISRRRFGQNQRSIFGFLNSAEPHGFQHFLQRSEDDSLYQPSQLWDYLRVNLEPSILASPDGHRWALAVEALERCESVGGDDLHIRLLKTIAVIDLFKERSELSPSDALLRTCFLDTTDQALTKSLRQLVKWSLVIYKKYLGAYAIYAGSDFDIDEAVRVQLEEIDSVDFSHLTVLSGLQPILAKRHYHETGTLRWFEITIAPLHDVVNLATNYQPSNGAIGQFVLTVAAQGESEKEAHKLCRNAARKSGKWDIVTAVSKWSRSIMSLARELIALENIRNDSLELSGDSVARKEVGARLANLQGKLENELRKSIDSAEWHRKNYSVKTYAQFELNKLASELADDRFNKCPKVHNELLNRQKPSGSAVAAQKALLRCMVLNEGKYRLGIEGFPAEGGLFASLLESTGIYINRGQSWCFVQPSINNSQRLFPIWEAADTLLSSNSRRTVSISEIYDLWRGEPFGVKDGLMTIFVMAYILSRHDCLAVYREGVFRTRLDDVDVDYLSKNGATIQLRWMDLSALSQRLLDDMADIVRSLDNENGPVDLKPIDVARGLVRVFENLPKWTKRTMHLSQNAIRVRDQIKRASDPNQFIFNDVPAVIGRNCDLDIASEEVIESVTRSLRKGLEELVQAYGLMLQQLKTIMFTELQVPDTSAISLHQLRERAENIRDVAGEFRLEAFIGRLSQFDGTDEAFEGIVSLVISKPSSAWVDLDIDRAMVEIADRAQRFLRTETFARVKNRSEKRHSMAVVIGKKGQSLPIVSDFQIGDADREHVDLLVNRLSTVLIEEDATRNNIILAALAELSSNYMTDSVDLDASVKKSLLR